MENELNHQSALTNVINGDVVNDDINLDWINLPPMLAGHATHENELKVKRYYLSVAQIFDLWLSRNRSRETQRAYRRGVLTLMDFLGIRWPEESSRAFNVTVADVQAWFDEMVEDGKAPKTINRRISCISSFYKFLGAMAAELRLPITVPNPAHAQFIRRLPSDPIKETPSLSATRARQLCGLPAGETIVDYRDRAILKFFLYSGARLGTACDLMLSDFNNDRECSTIRLKEKGGKTRTIGIHFAAAEAIQQYVDFCGICAGPLFRPRASSNASYFAKRSLSRKAMRDIVNCYLRQLPGSLVEVGRNEDETPIFECRYTPHSLRATTATLLLEAGEDIRKVQELLGHRHVVTTEIYDRRRISKQESASHHVPI
ncbi:MAG: tyrosine-type recombinase/integrase [Planctomycetota bacterium]